jgi:hypothetical protein
VAEWLKLYETASQIGLPFGIAVFVFLLYKRRLYWWWQYDDLDKSCKKTTALNERLVVAILKSNGANETLVKALEGHKEGEA